MDTLGGFKQPATAIEHPALLAFVEIDVLEIRNRLASVRPHSPWKNAELVIVDRHIHAGLREIGHRRGEFIRFWRECREGRGVGVMRG